MIKPAKEDPAVRGFLGSEKIHECDSERKLTDGQNSGIDSLL